MSFTLADLKTLARQRADMEGSTFIKDAELKNYINFAYSELYDLLTSRFEDYFLAPPVTFTLASPANSFDLPADFYKMRGMDTGITAEDWLAMKKFNFNERNYRNRGIDRLRYGVNQRSYRVMGQKVFILPEQEADGTYRMWYIPRFTPLVNDTDIMGDVLDFHDYVVIDAAMKMLVKEESDITALAALKAGLKQRIEQMSSNRDAGSPERISDVLAVNSDFDPLWRRG